MVDTSGKESRQAEGGRLSRLLSLWDSGASRQFPAGQAVRFLQLCEQKIGVWVEFGEAMENYF